LTNLQVGFFKVSRRRQFPECHPLHEQSWAACSHNKHDLPGRKPVCRTA
jgi:hypothetical protein